MGKHDLRIFLLVRADARVSASSLSSLMAALPAAPFHWLVPSCVFSSAADSEWYALLDELQERRPLDMLISAGYTGAPHPILQLEELRRELDWGFHPPGDGGHRVRPLAGVLAPAAADTVRPDALRLYCAKGVHRLLVPAPPEAGSCAGGSVDTAGGPIEVLYYHEIEGGGLGSPRRILSNARAGREAASPAATLGLSLGPGAEAARSLATLLERLGGLARVAYLRLDQPLEPLQAPPAAWCGNGPQRRERAASVAALRKHRQDSDETASVLQVLAGLRTLPGPERSVDVFPALRRENTALMMGAITLSDGPLAAHFEAGRLAGLSWADRLVTPALPCRSYAGPLRKPRPYDVTGAFALEADRARGLRSLHRLAVDHAALTLEYVFVEDFRYLVVTGRARFPSRRGLEEVQPFEVPVARADAAEPVAVHVLSRSEAPYRVLVSDDLVFLAGSLFWFEGAQGGLVAGFPPLKEPPLEGVRLRFEKSGGGRILLASFFGVHDAFQALPGGSELFSLYLGIAFEPPTVLPAFPRSVLDEIPQHAIAAR